MGRHENEIALQQQSADASQQQQQQQLKDIKVADKPTEASTSPAGSDEQYDTQTEEMIANAWEKTKTVAEKTLHAAEGAWEKTKGAAVAVKDSIVGKPHANDEIARGKKDDDASTGVENAVHDAAAAAAGERASGEHHDETLKEKVQHIAGAAWGKTKEVAEVAWEKTRETAIAVKDKVVHEEIPPTAKNQGEGADDEKAIPDAPRLSPSLPSDAHPIAPTNQRDLQIDRKQLKVPVKTAEDIPNAELPKDDEELHADFEREQFKAPMRPGGIGQAPPVSELTFGGGEPAKEGGML